MPETCRNLLDVFFWLQTTIVWLRIGLESQIWYHWNHLGMRNVNISLIYVNNVTKQQRKHLATKFEGGGDKFAHRGSGTSSTT